ncbi:hypothetical protein FN846DRAFT_979699 [Sphaerosporella brunnea]|uniref:VLRF1 domain-containing protein n=1 Tax=Sphaerosporella brunnea TaxID=1250544 RepID=A0A5J5EDE0_9PEZI|nr:hypothetical protein FN846DRAFT_979699 [Sphaerosporella brunnea]
MAAPASEDILKRPLYVYDLPAPLLASITLKTDVASTTETDPKEPTLVSDDGSLGCALCGSASSSVPEQRAHFRSDWHRFNLKLKLRSRPAVKDEAEFEKMLEAIEESISGSDDESDESEDDKDGVATLVRKTEMATIEEDGAVVRWKRGAGKPPLVWFASPLLPDEVSLGVYRALFTPQEQAQGGYLEYVRARQLTAGIGGTTSPHMFMCMIGGGHFAAMIVSLAPKVGQGNREAVVLAHKTFHRYTTRRKQGGSQSANDNAKGAAHSAGAQIRRHNEATLISEVRELLNSWKELLDTASLLFVRATGAQNRRTLFGYEDSPLKSNDPRIRGFPFSTRRATQSELMRCFVELTRLKVSRVDQAALQALQTPTPTPATTTTTKSTPAAIAAPPKLSKEEEEAQLHTSQLTALIRRSKAPAVLSYLSSNNLPVDFKFFPPSANHHAPTPLHLAAALNAPAVVNALLLKAAADPSVLNADGKSAFLLAGDRATRDAFRVARSELGEKRWAWDAAGVPGPLKRAEMEERERREREEADRGERERREREVERIRLEEEAKGKKKRGGLKGMALGGGGVVTALNKREEEERGLTPEARLRLERERRARAAEERVRRLQGR